VSGALRETERRALVSPRRDARLHGADCRDATIRFSVGHEPGETVLRAILELPETAWVAAIDAGG
jgi:hypothetical protein